MRYGISYWLWGDADVVDTITARFGINQCAPFLCYYYYCCLVYTILDIRHS